MSDTYTKLFRSLAASTIVSEPLATRWLWVTLLSQADKAGRVYGSIPGLARLANITLPDTETALAALMSPDPYSRTPDHEGRRLEAFDGGWRLLNHAKYAAMRDEAERAEYKREWDRKHRSAKAKDTAGQSDSNPTIRHESDKSDSTDNPDPTSTNTNTKKEQKQKTAPDGDLLDGISPQVASDFKALRSRLRAPITATAMRGIRREAMAAGLSLEAALVMCCERGWRGFKAEWVAGNPRAGPAAAPSKHLTGLANIFGVNPHDLIDQQPARTVVRHADRELLGDDLRVEPRRLPGG